MPLRLDLAAAEAAFDRALALAVSDSQLPAEWIEISRRVSAARSKTFTPMLGTALLAKATDRRVDALSIKAGRSHRGYSARELAKEVLVPAAVRNGIDLRTTGVEPLNNQPFFRYERVSPDMAVRPNVQVDLEFLHASLERADFLEGEDALHAFAAFLRVRLEVAPARFVPAVSAPFDVPGILSAACAFAETDPEGGRRGQALIAAALDLVYDGVRTARVNDPSRRLAGDVVVGSPPATVVEVKQRPASETEILQFSQRLAGRGCRAMVACLHPRQSRLDVQTLTARAWNEHRVVLSVILGARTFLEEALRWSNRDLELSATAFPRQFGERMSELEVATSTLDAWAEEIARLAAGQ